MPLPGAHVVLIAGVDPADAGPVRETETDCDGRLYFFNLEPGPYFLVAEARGFQPERAHVEVEAGQVTGHRFLPDPQ